MSCLATVLSCVLFLETVGVSRRVVVFTLLSRNEAITRRALP